MASFSKNIFSIYDSQFFKYIMLIGVCLVVGDLTFETVKGTLHMQRAIIDIWALATYLAYFLSQRSPRRKYLLKLIVLLSLILLALCVKLG
ncbi:MAG: hypothetical protein K2H60_08475 [Muribaculaceae bacterium]|nr:hypothetical protein [Muribaculaceae bacterium]